MDQTAEVKAVLAIVRRVQAAHTNRIIQGSDLMREIEAEVGKAATQFDHARLSEGELHHDQDAQS